MKERNFALFLAALVMLLGAGASVWQKGRQEDARMRAQSAAVRIQEEREAKEGEAKDGEEILLPAFGTPKQEYGAVYSDQYGQWTLSECMVWTVEGMREVSAPLSGTVVRIEPQTEGGSRVRIDCGDAAVEIFPIYNVRVFSGSRTARGDVIGTARESLTLRAYRDDLPTDPRQIGKTSSFDASAGAGQKGVE